MICGSVASTSMTGVFTVVYYWPSEVLRGCRSRSVSDLNRDERRNRMVVQKRDILLPHNTGVSDARCGDSPGLYPRRYPGNRLRQGYEGCLGMAGSRCLHLSFSVSLLTAGLMYWSAIGVPPAVLREDEPKSKRASFFITLVLVVAFVASGELLNWGNGKAIGWIADRNPDAAYAAGVTGSIPPSWHKK